MNKFVASCVSRTGDEGRDASPPISVPANPFYSALIRMLEVSDDNDHQTEALRLAKQYCAKGELTGLQLALSVARIQAQSVIDQIEDIAALFPHDIDNSTQVYGDADGL